MNLCKCSCGQPAKEGNRFIFNHHLRGDRNPAKRPEVRKKIGLGNKGKCAGDKNPAKRHDVRARIRKTRLEKNPEEWNRKISEGLRRYFSSGGKSSNYGKRFTKEHRQKIGDAQRGEKGPNWKGGRKPVKCEACEKIFRVGSSRLGEARYCSQKCYHSVCQGPNHPGWLGGKSFKPYSWEFHKLRGIIKERDSYRCQLCGGDGHKRGYLHVHHIDYNKENNNPANLITLCVSCNPKVNYHRDYWTNFFSSTQQHPVS